MNFFFGLLILVTGGLLVYYARQIEKWFGRWDWAENYLGWTAQAYVLIWFFLIVLGLLAVFWVVRLQ